MAWIAIEREHIITLYSNNNKLQLPLKLMEVQFKVTRARQVVQYRHSSDPKVDSAGIQMRASRSLT